MNRVAHLHWKNVCPRGHVLSQCRCPSPNKTIHKIPDACRKCAAEDKKKHDPSRRVRVVISFELERASIAEARKGLDAAFRSAVAEMTDPGESYYAGEMGIRRVGKKKRSG